MNGLLKQNDLDRLVEHFGVERIIAALPQSDVCEILELVCLKDLTDELGMHYETIRTHMEKGVIPFPEVRILRRAYFRKEEADAIKKKLKQLDKKSLAPKRKQG